VKRSDTLTYEEKGEFNLKKNTVENEFDCVGWNLFI